MSNTYKDYFPVISRSSAAAGIRAGFYEANGSQLARADYSAIPLAEKQALLSRQLDSGLHGLSFSPYMQGQEPGQELADAQIRDRMKLIAPHCDWVRTFSCTDGNQNSPRIAHELGLKVMVGVGLGEDRELNEREFCNGLEIARAGHVDIFAVGNEVLLREDLSEDELLDYIQRAKDALPGVPVGYVDAYFLFENYPRVTEACDVILINCYPFWESCPLEYAVAYMNVMYQRAKAVANGKRVIISETGWPSEGEAYGAAVPGYENAIDYFLETTRWVEQEGIDLFYFSSFDESWKVGGEGDVGAYWGLWDEHGNRKFTE